MSGILDKFAVEHSVQGAKVIARTVQLSGHCTDDDEVDDIIALLKDDLDACGREMKRLLKVNRGSIFEGWPTRN